MIEEKQISCNSCSGEFYIEYSNEDFELIYCPFCGNELIEELDFD
jgi:predicted RNA-binding Zn-ribbon protein involved in translation (DUF1610 family)